MNHEEQIRQRLQTIPNLTLPRILTIDFLCETIIKYDLSATWVMTGEGNRSDTHNKAIKELTEALTQSLQIKGKETKPDLRNLSTN